MELKQALAQAQQDVVHTLESYFHSQQDAQPRILAASQYSVQNGGKRLRPFLVYCVGTMLGANKSDLDKAAAAIECIHSYSLVHDDLPAMDDDELRRGRPTCHIAYDEAHAILAGDALQSIAFELLSANDFNIEAGAQIRLVQSLSRAAGLLGMVGGQALDIAATGKSISLNELEQIHNAKTGALLSCAIELGYLCAPKGDNKTETALQQYGKAIGLAFQVQDDILDIEGDTQTLGKPQGSDVAANKATYPALLGLDGAKAKLKQLYDEAIAALDSLPYDTKMLAQLAQYIIARDH
ncbi:(2E,6E)-farnesyl diphosphate synthase [Pseudoalteromonas sp. BDTF-M6]|uniref:(2E,6E)-farnesyl diphosphate synthase n=1 Tax=Pseudoalteromonas sp. BDTF-M6 TaxID=2796132 RepID=UPI001BAF0C36|nr:(2E,6E)-farnesyl diphosphate synthase [Pseudoalteromonas sp. BDTF-M6]